MQKYIFRKYKCIADHQTSLLYFYNEVLYIVFLKLYNIKTMNNKLLSEYKYVLKEIDHIKNSVSILKSVTQNRLKYAKSKEEKNQIYSEFQEQLCEIKNDKSIKHKYKNLIKKQNFIENEILQKMSIKNNIKNEPENKLQYNQPNYHDINISDDISNLIRKYKDNSVEHFDEHVINIQKNDKYSCDNVFYEDDKSNIKLESDFYDKNDNDDKQIERLCDLVKDLQCDFF